MSLPRLRLPRPRPGGQARRSAWAKVSRSGRPGLEALEDRRVLDAGISGQGIAFSALKGNNPGVLEVASFSGSPAALPAGTYTATIDWGDGTTPTPGLVKTLPPISPILRGRGIPSDAPPAPRGVVSVLGDHTYAQAGDFPVQVRLTAPGGGTALATTAAHVAFLLADGITQNASTGAATPFPILADFRASEPLAQPGDFAATINWGDGSAPVAGTIDLTAPSIDPSQRYFRVGGEHTYTTFPTDKATVTITDRAGHSATASSPVLVLPGGGGRENKPFSAVAGSATGPVALPAPAPVVDGANGPAVAPNSPATGSGPSVPAATGMVGGETVPAPATTVSGPKPPFRGFSAATWHALTASSPAPVPGQSLGRQRTAVHPLAPGAPAHTFAFGLRGKGVVSASRHRGR